MQCVVPGVPSPMAVCVRLLCEAYITELFFGFALRTALPQSGGTEAGCRFAAHVRQVRRDQEDPSPAELDTAHRTQLAPTEFRAQEEQHVVLA